MPEVKTAPADLDSRAATRAAGARAHTAEVLPRGARCDVEFPWQRKKPRESLTIGNILHFAVGVLFLWPVFLIVAAAFSIGHLVTFVRSSLEAVLSSGLWLGMLSKEWAASWVMHRDNPRLLKLRGSRRALGHEVARDWSNAGKALLGIGRKFSGAFGLGGLFAAFEQRVQRAGAEWRRYVVASAPVGATPGDFPDNYVIVDQLPPGGSSARLYVVRKKNDKGVADENGPLFVLKYFDLMQGGNLESVVRESQAAELAKKLGLIIESNLGTRAFWYVMPYYQGRTLTRATLDGVKEARKQGLRAVFDHRRLALGWTHQVLQIIAQYHEAGVFHKDIKPDNLIVNGERIYLVDIGLMTPLSSMHQLTTHGTEYFRDPEMVKLALEGREVRQVNAGKFDIYSIGAVLYFAVEGEFPTSGPLSRFSTDVPMAVQWVANRAMAGMNQRYETARQMLADVDYLCWAAAQGMLDQVKPADLPSFRGMPLPQHLMPPAQVGYAQTRHYAQGGYGAWYMAPAFRPQLRSRRARYAVVGGVLAGVMGLVGAGVVASVVLVKTHNQSSHQLQGESQALSAQLPHGSEGLAPLYDQIERGMRDHGVNIETTTHTGVLGRTVLAPEVLKLVNQRLSPEPRKSKGLRIRINERKPLSQTPPELIIIASGAMQAELAAGIERELTLEAARGYKGVVAVFDATEREQLAALVNGISDRQAMHREMAVRYARQGKAPPLLVLLSVEDGEGPAQRELHLRSITPGQEWHDVLAFENS